MLDSIYSFSKLVYSRGGREYSVKASLNALITENRLNILSHSREDGTNAKETAP